MWLGNQFAHSMAASNFHPRMTGHSLGGGLASAASIAANAYSVPANTFNAAGLHINTITLRDEDGYLMDGIPAYAGAFNQYYREMSGFGNINAYQVAFDVLTFVQQNLPPLPTIGRLPCAAGKPITIIGPQHNSVKQTMQEIQRLLSEMPDFSGEVTLELIRRFCDWLGQTFANNKILFEKVSQLHKMQSALYGLMVERKINNLERNPRVFDIFGYAANED
jgi:hypothetical protein